jgi:hypothetical protein
MRISEAAKQLGVSPATVRKAVREGTITAAKIDDAAVHPTGWRWDIDPRSVEANQGRWKGRGKYRRQEPDEPVLIETIEVASPPREVSELPPPSTQSKPVRTWDSSGWYGAAIVGIGAVLVLGTWLRVRMEQAQGQPARPPAYVFDPVTLRWYEQGDNAGSNRW